MKKPAGKMTSDDKKQLSSLGYISPFSGNSDKKEDPKKAIVLDNQLKGIFKLIGKDRLDEAESQLDQLETSNAENGGHMFHMMRFQIYQKRGDSAKCELVLKDAMEKFPDNKPFYILYALQMFDAGNYAEGRATCRKLLERHPDFTHAYTLLGDMDEKEGKLQTALEFYKKAFDIEPENIRLKLKYADMLIRAGNFKDAIIPLRSTA